MASFVFYEDYFNVGKRLKSAEEKVLFYEAIYYRGLYGTDLPITDNETINTAFVFIETLIQANEKRRSDGKKGGRPQKKETIEKPVVKPVVSPNKNLNSYANSNKNTNSDNNSNINSNDNKNNNSSSFSNSLEGNASEEDDWLSEVD